MSPKALRKTLKNEGVPIVKEGVPFLLVSLFVTLAFAVWKIWPAFILFLILSGFVAYFFRNPERLPPVGALHVASPADGKVIFVGLTHESEFLNQTMKKISIFMSVFDVHVNRVPVDGTVTKMKYHRGRFMAAFEDRASDENERNVMCIETPQGEKVVLAQIAGLVARRIVCYPAVGSFVLRGQRLGLIRFGSRCDIYVPESSEVLVKVGERVWGGETILAQFKNSKGTA